MKNITKSMLYRTLRLLPPRTRGRLDYELGRQNHFFPWGGAFNGQTLRRELCRRVLVKMIPDLIVETGTYRGTTTEFLAQFGSSVLTIESNARFHEFSSRRLSKLQNVNVIFGSSDLLLEGFGKRKMLNGNVFGYLDAHWEKHLPLRAEISAILKSAPTFVILVDDFKVPGEPSYEFDDYADAGACTIEHIRDLLDEKIKIFYPNVSAEHETGEPRGYCFISRGKQNIELLESFPEITMASSFD